jgi:ergothioneine biosynthesis protein EgtB
MRQIGSEVRQGFCFDNETPRHPVYVAEFQLADRLVSNADYLEFVQAEGYARPELWLSDGWAAVIAGRFGTDPAPLYWRKRDGNWCEYRLSGLAPLEDAEPVSHVSYFEADAYARWAGQRLPTEFEWEVAAVDASGPALQQLYTHCWQWTMSAYAPYPGFHPLPGALGEYNGKFMSGQMVLRGGSVATAAGHGRATYRNFFYPVDRWQFTGIRLAADGPSSGPIA